MRDCFKKKILSPMKKILTPIAAILCLGSIVYLAGTWVEDVTLEYAIVHNGSALLVALLSGLYLKKQWGRDIR